MATGRLSGVIRRVRRGALLADGGGMTDGQLLACYLSARDEAAFAALVRRHGPMVLAVCGRVLRHVHDVEDAFQATFLVLARKAASVAQRELLANWLYGVAYRAALEARAARRRREKQVRDLPEPAVMDRADDGSDLRTVLDRELNRLPEKYRVPVVLCDLEGRTRRDVARQLGIPAGTLSGRLTTARRILARRLTRRGLTLSAGTLAAVLSQGAASAGVPAALVCATTRTVHGGAAVPVASTQAAALAERVVRTMLLRKLKGVMALFVVCLALGATALWALRAPAADPRVAAVAVPSGPAAPRANARLPQQQGDVVIVQTDTIHTVAFDPDSKLLAGGSEDKKVRIWDMSDNKLKWTLTGPKGMVRKVVFSKDGKTLAAGADDGGVFLWDMTTGKLQTELHADLPKKPAGAPGSLVDPVLINGLVFLPGGKLAAAYNYQMLAGAEHDSQIKIWDLGTNKEVTLHKQKGPAYSLSLSPDGTLLAATLQGDFEGFKVWDLDSRKVVWEEKSGADFMSAVVFAPDGKKLAVGGGHPIQMNEGVRVEARLWLFDVTTKKQLWHAKEPDNWAYSQMAFTADGKGLLTGSSGAIRDYVTKGGVKGKKVVSELRRWDVATGKVTWKAEGELGHFTAVAAAPDGKALAGSDSEQLMLFDPDTGTLREVLVKVKYGP